MLCPRRRSELSSTRAYFDYKNVYETEEVIRAVGGGRREGSAAIRDRYSLLGRRLQEAIVLQERHDLGF